MTNCRPARSDDIPLLARMNRRLIQDEQHRSRLSDDELHERMTGWLDSGYDAALIECGGKCVGYALFRWDGPELYLRQFFVERGYRRQGIGRQAFDILCRDFWSPAERIRLDVLVHNAAARHFWEAVGFSEYCITMERTLDQE